MPAATIEERIEIPATGKAHTCASWWWAWQDAKEVEVRDAGNARSADYPRKVVCAFSYLVDAVRIASLDRWDDFNW
jgi:hypothetical protein